MAAQGRDDEATAIICAAVGRLHRKRRETPPPLVPLAEHFRSLVDRAHDGLLGQCAEAARSLLAAPRDVVPLHGDIHHGNILDFGPRGWLAIDPKGVIGERAFDYANLFLNPDGSIATSPGRLARQARIVADAAGLDHERLLRWGLAWAGLSALWALEDGDHAHGDLALSVASIVLAEQTRHCGL